MYRVLLHENGKYIRIKNQQTKKLSFADRVNKLIDKGADASITNSQVDNDDEYTKEFVIQIINQQIISDGEVSTITYFKEVTSVIQYE